MTALSFDRRPRRAAILTRMTALVPLVGRSRWFSTRLGCVTHYSLAQKALDKSKSVANSKWRRMRSDSPLLGPSSVPSWTCAYAFPFRVSSFRNGPDEVGVGVADDVVSGLETKMSATASLGEDASNYLTWPLCWRLLFAYFFVLLPCLAWQMPL